MADEKMLSKRIQQRNTIDSYALHPPFPTKMKLEVANLCNHDCVFCCRSKITTPKIVIDKEFAQKILADAYSLGVREVGFFIHGEPTLCKELESHIQTAKRLGYEYVYITTNGVYMTPQRLRSLVAAGMDSLKFSINAGSRETYRQIHGKDDYDSVMDNLHYCAQYRKELDKPFNLFISCIITNVMEHEIEWMKQTLSPLVDEIAFYKARGCGGMMPENASLNGGFTSVKKCALPFHAIHINCSGDLLGCDNDANNTFQIANLYETSLLEAWAAPGMLELRQRHLEGDVRGTKCEICLAEGGGAVEVLSR